MKKAYIQKNFRHASLVLIDKCEKILQRYHQQGYDMTLRQLYYQLVSADEIENKKESYDNLGSLMNDARLAGYIDWSHLVDRGRNLKGLATYESPKDRLSLVPYGYHLDKWSDPRFKQKYKIEVWIEKEALEGVFARSCNQLGIDFFACKGYTSVSEMYVAANRLLSYKKNGQTPLILHHGDHDPSGLDMTRDIFDRLSLFMGGVEVKRMALNMPQIERYNPPPNYAKVLDSRFKEYQAKYGDMSWELDALDPQTLNQLVTDTVLSYRDDKLWQAAVAQENYDIAKLHQIHDKYDDIRIFLDENYPDYKAPASDEDADDTTDYTTYCENLNCENEAEEDGSYCATCEDLLYCEADNCYNKAEDGESFCEKHK
jgi:hypothetical protein